MPVIKGNISWISSYTTKSGKRRIFRCSGCEGTFSENRNTVFFDLKSPEEKLIIALKMSLVRVSLSSISFVLGVKKETVLTWLDRASRKPMMDISAFGSVMHQDFILFWLPLSDHRHSKLRWPLLKWQHGSFWEYPFSLAMVLAVISRRWSNILPYIKTFARTGRKDPPKNPVKEPHPELVYCQVVKEKKVEPNKLRQWLQA